MHHPTFPVSWQEIAASYDPRGLPFLRYYQEAGMLQRHQDPVSTILVRGDDGER
ncbi:MAG: hypothetical protein ABIJ09_16525 [Pseudomonadota bacterium]